MTDDAARPVALLSGASRGIGLAIARRLTADGWRLSLGMRAPEPLEGVDPEAQLVAHDATKADEAAWVEGWFLQLVTAQDIRVTMLWIGEA